MSEDNGEVKNKKKFPMTLVAVVIAFVLGGAAAAYGVKMKPEVLGLSKGQAQAQAEADKLVGEVGKLISLPSDEKPTIATVSDAEKVKSQAFFKNAANGDRVLIYTNAKKAILYRPSENRIVEVGAVNINQQPQASTAPTVEPTASPEAAE